MKRNGSTRIKKRKKERDGRLWMIGINRDTGLLNASYANISLVPKPRCPQAEVCIFSQEDISFPRTTE